MIGTLLVCLGLSLLTSVYVVKEIDIYHGSFIYTAIIIQLLLNSIGFLITAFVALSHYGNQQKTKQK